MAKDKVVYLIDGHNLLYKAHFSFIARPLINSKGMNTSVPFGFLNMLKVLFHNKKPQYLAIAFDRAEPTFRKTLFEDYKATRPPMPDEIRNSIPIIYKLTKAFGIPILEQEGYEADDLLATVAKQLEEKGFFVNIISGDKDLYQIVNENIHLLVPRQGLTELEEVDVGKVIQKWGVKPSQIPDLIALMGDTADNIPGVPGIGPKRAAKLLQQFNSVENLIENLSQIKNKKLKKLIENNIENIKLGKKLALIKTDVPVKLDISRLQQGHISYDELHKLFMELEFRQFAKEFLPDRDTFKKEYKIVQTEEQLEELIINLYDRKIFTFDTETTSPDPINAELVGISFCIDEGIAYYIPLKHKTDPFHLELKTVLNELKPIFEDEGFKKIGHNCKYDNIILRNYGINVKGIYFDTMVASYLINPSRRQHNLDALALEYLKWKKISYKDLTEQKNKKKKGLLITEVLLHKLMEYACEDADVTYRLYQIFKKELKNLKLEELFYKLEIPLIKVLEDMEIWGVKIDVNYLTKLDSVIQKQMLDLQKQLYELVGMPFKINSPKELNYILYEKLKIPVKGLRRTTWGRATDEQTLREIIRNFPNKKQVPELILQYRTLSKLRSTYIVGLVNLVNPKTGRLHTSFNQTVTETGRLSSSEPNLQNIPIRGQWGKEIRKAFIPEKGWKLISADYSQMELRILAHFSEDPELIRAFNENKDIHRHTASLIFDVVEREVTPEQRRMAKTVNFGIDYGMTPYGLSQRLNIDVNEAKVFMDKYFKRYPKIKDYIEKTIEIARKNGYVTTIMNRRRYLPAINDSRRHLREASERKAINMPIQGSAADIIKMAMIEIHSFIKKRKLKTKMILQIHDELLFEAPENEVDLVMKNVKEIMENVVKLKVPLKVSINAGDNWADIH